MIRDCWIRCSRFVVPVALVVPMTACVTFIRDLSVVSVEARTDSAIGKLPDRPVIAVSLRTRTNLSRLPKDELIHAEGFFCDRPNDFVVLGRSILVDASRLPLNDAIAMPEGTADKAGAYTYTVLLETRRRGSPDSRPPEVGFDLSAAPQSVCIRFQGGYLADHASSNTVRIPAARIRDALAHYDGKLDH
jgi:hypothetical protein